MGFAAQHACDIKGAEQFVAGYQWSGQPSVGLGAQHAVTLRRLWLPAQELQLASLLTQGAVLLLLIVLQGAPKEW